MDDAGARERLVRFVAEALPILEDDARVVGVAAGGSFAQGGVDVHSDLDLVVAVEPAAHAAVLAEAPALAARLGPLLAAFTGEHVGEPRLLICLYGPPLLHVDLKFVALPELAARVEDPLILWQREARMRRALDEGVARWPAPDLQWIEDRFWVWVHYVAGKIARGELLEVIDGLALLRRVALGPLVAVATGHRPQGVRRLESRAGAWRPALEATVAGHDRDACIRALYASIALYRALRDALASADLRRGEAAERESILFLDDVASQD
ncbi:MAG: oxalate:formate antiporter [bacterium]|nr:oxalate:formate antiporter [bacterium]